MSTIDLLAIVTRCDFPSGQGPIGDHLGLARFSASRPRLVVRTIALNTRQMRLNIAGDAIQLTPGDETPIDLSKVRLVLYMPVCLEIEETNLAATAPNEPYSLFAAQQWRPVTGYLEEHLARRIRCVNEPRFTRLANNKLIQHATLRGARIELPQTVVSTGYPVTSPLGSYPRLVRKNLSEGGWKSETEFSPARLVSRNETWEATPAIWQAPIDADHEYRVYVMGEEVIFVRLERERAAFDVRMTRGGRPQARIVRGGTGWKDSMRAAAKALRLDYAVIDAMPVEDRLVVLEVNANGVWWFLPDKVGDELERRFHAFLDRLLAISPRAVLT